MPCPAPPRPPAHPPLPRYLPLKGEAAGLRQELERAQKRVVAEELRVRMAGGGGRYEGEGDQWACTELRG